MTVDILKNAINEVLTNKSYAENMQIRSKRFRDTPMKPLDTAIWWIEYILRHPNPHHLLSPVHNLGYFIANSYDIIFFILFILSCISIVLYKIIKIILLRINSNGKIKVKYEKKNK